jgi:hypothetical protein
MAKIFRSLVLICLIACAASQLFMFPKTYSSENQPEKIGKVNIDDLNLFMRDVFKAFINSLKNPTGPTLNPYNRCIWRICSKPLRNITKEFLNLKEMKALPIILGK